MTSMNEFTKEELQDIYDAVMNTELPMFENLPSKIQSMIDNYCEPEEKEIFSCHTGLAVDDDFFCGKQSLTGDDLLPAIHQLVNQCDGMIRSSGIYAFKLKLVKMK